jgi:hypothetical protein
VILSKSARNGAQEQLASEQETRQELEERLALLQTTQAAAAAIYSGAGSEEEQQEGEEGQAQEQRQHQEQRQTDQVIASCGWLCSHHVYTQHHTVNSLKEQLQRGLAQRRRATDKPAQLKGNSRQDQLSS